MTETLCALGLGESLVGATSYCIFPESIVGELPKVGGTKTPRVQAIRELRPDLVHMNLEENLESHAEEIRAFADVFVSEPRTVDDVDSLLRDIGSLHRAEPAADGLRAALRRVREQLAAKRRRFRFAAAIWKNPWMWAGGDTYISDLVSRAGGTNVLGDRSRYPSVTPADVQTLRPDVILLPDEPWRFREEDAAALRETGVTVIGPFPGHYLTWHGVRTIEGLQYLNAILT